MLTYLSLVCADTDKMWRIFATFHLSPYQYITACLAMSQTCHLTDGLSKKAFPTGLSNYWYIKKMLHIIKVYYLLFPKLISNFFIQNLPPMCKISLIDCQTTKFTLGRLDFKFKLLIQFLYHNQCHILFGLSCMLPISFMIHNILMPYFTQHVVIFMASL